MNTNGTGTKTIVFRKGDEYRVRIEDYSGFKNSLFSEVYARAARAVASIHNTHKTDCTKKDFNMHDYNNVISFIGARGTGKTSSMISFARALESFKKAPNDEGDFWNQSHAKDIHQMNFHQLDIIDPSLFDDNNNILEIVIAKMFAAFGKKLKDEDTKKNYDTKRKLLQHFQTVHENLKTIANERKEVLRGETIEVLEKLASSGNLRENMIQLVESYLNFMGKDNHKDNNYLIIAIDDIDLNVKYAYTMVEQIRRYLIIPHVIILMAAKLEQLSDAIEQQYRRQFSDMLPHTVHHTHYDETARPYSYQMQLADDPKDMTERYLEKLIPEDRRLYLPQIGQYGSESCLVIETEAEQPYIINGTIEKMKDKEKERIKKDTAYFKASLENKTISNEEYTVANLILHLIKTKVGIEFVKPMEGIHPIIPQNLRELHNLACLLIKMEDKDETKAINKDNFLRFADYFNNNWVPQNTSREVDAIITEFRSKPDDQKNKFIIQTLDQHFNNEDSLINKLHDKAEKNDTVQPELLLVLDEKNYSFNVSIGDVLFVLDKLSQCNYRDYAAHLIFAVKTAYTIELHRRALWDENDEAVQKIIGGRLYNEQNVTLIRKTAEGNRRDWFKFKYDYNDLKQNAENSYPKKMAISYLNSFLVHIGELKDDYRSRQEKFFVHPEVIHNKTTQAQFDVLLPLSNGKYYNDSKVTFTDTICNVEQYESTVKQIDLDPKGTMISYIDYLQNFYKSDFVSKITKNKRNNIVDLITLKPICYKNILGKSERNVEDSKVISKWVKNIDFDEGIKEQDIIKIFKSIINRTEYDENKQIDSIKIETYKDMPNRTKLVFDETYLKIEYAILKKILTDIDDTEVKLRVKKKMIQILFFQLVLKGISTSMNDVEKMVFDLNGVLESMIKFKTITNDELKKLLDSYKGKFKTTYISRKKGYSIINNLKSLGGGEIKKDKECSRVVKKMLQTSKHLNSDSYYEKEHVEEINRVVVDILEKMLNA